jgi:hypothetical protein
MAKNVVGKTSVCILAIGKALFTLAFGASGLFKPQTLMYNPQPPQVTQKLYNLFTFLAITPGIWTLSYVLYGSCVKLLGRVYEL